jgi:uncharacterized protein YkwD
MRRAASFRDTVPAMRSLVVVILAACGGSQVANVPPPSADQARAPTQAMPPPLSDSLDECRQHNLDVLNRYRAQAGNLEPLALDASLSAFAQRGSEQYARDQMPHAHMRENGRATFRGRYRHENQGPKAGTPIDTANLVASCKERVETLIDRFMEKGPGEGHHDAVMDPRHHLLGVGLHVHDSLLWITNDFLER